MAGETILVIDDSPTIIKVVHVVLTRAGYRVDSAPDGEAGLAQAELWRPDLILLDLVMPRLNFSQVCRALADSATLRQVPVVLMSARSDEMSQRLVRSLEIADFISKPFSPEALVAVVENTLSKQRVHRAPTVVPGAFQLPAAPKDEPAVVAAAAAEPSPASSLAGELQVAPLPEVLSLLGARRQTGLLSLEPEGSSAVTVAFRDGRIAVAFAAGTEPSEAALAEMGPHEFSALRQRLTSESRERLFELLRCPRGQFRFVTRRELPPLAERVALDLEVDKLLLEGCRRIDEWHLIQHEMNDFDAVFVRNEALLAKTPPPLAVEERAILDLANGRHSVKDIARVGRVTNVEAAKILYRLLTVKLIRRRVPPVAMD